MTKTVFIIHRVGVYRHACGGVFSNAAKARVAADYLADEDVDDHHTYEVVPHVLDQGPVLDREGGYSPRVVEADPVYRVCKPGRIT